MEKRIKIQDVGLDTGQIGKFCPVKEACNSIVNFIMKNNFEHFNAWPETEPISRLDFEESLHFDQDLAAAYIDEFSSDAEYLLCTITHEDLDYKFYIMLVQGEIVLLYLITTDPIVD